jgi:hypothetical protein
MSWRVLTVTACLGGVAACGGGGGGGDGPNVDWSNYSPAVRSRIDQAAAAKDCALLQSEFNTADSNDDAQRARTGNGNADLMSYIDAKMKSAGC